MLSNYERDIPSRYGTVLQIRAQTESEAEQ